VVAVEVFPSPSRPLYVKAVGYPAGVYARVGSTNRQADATTTELQRVVRGRSPPLSDLNSEAIAFRVASEYFTHVPQRCRADYVRQA